MNCKIKKWELTDAGDLAKVLSNTKVQDKLLNWDTVLRKNTGERE